MSVAPGAAPEDGLVEFLRNEQLVRVIDNCEHLIGAASFSHGELPDDHPAGTASRPASDP